MKNISKLFSALCAMAFIAGTSAVYAASELPVTLKIEGNPTCNSVAGNFIFEARDTSVDGGDGDPLIFTENGQTLIYTVAGDGITLSFSSTTAEGSNDSLGVPLFPVNIVILKGAANTGATVAHWGDNGVLKAEGLVGPGTLKTVSFCYGLEGATVKPPETVHVCTDLSGAPLPVLGEVGVVCPETDDYSIHIIKKGDDGFEYDECTCNETATVCDPELAAGTDGACTSDITVVCPDITYPATLPDEGGVYYETRDECLEANQLKAAPGAIIPWDNGSGWCSSILGSISCKTW